jgi:hypothetical protein
MKRAIQLLAAVLAVAVVSLWFAKGANTGWTKNRVQVKAIDPITEIEQIEWRQTFVPGVDVLGAGLAVAGTLLVGALFIRKQNS